ncbi:MAG: DUF5011 domain-containing protein, partial [Clostridiales bacterium]|nr:DUF5011 domain-containing protein [Clostridiales bacterium]
MKQIKSEYNPCLAPKATRVERGQLVLGWLFAVALSILSIALIALVPNGLTAQAEASGDPPVITLLGPETLYLEKGTSYKEYDATAYDTENGDLTDSIAVNSDAVNINVVNTYSVTYSVTDEDENTARETRTVIVYDTEPFAPTGLDDETIGYESSFDLRSGVSVSDGGATVDSIEEETEFSTVTVGHHKLIYNISVSGGGDKNFRLTRIVTVEPYSAIQSGDVYDGSAVLDVLGGAAHVNGAAFNRNDVFSTPGDSEIVITGINGYEKTIPFTVNLIQAGIIPNYKYEEPVALAFSGGAAVLDGNQYVSGTTVATKGNHTIRITGAGGFEWSVSFSILPTVLNVADGWVYSTAIYPNINAENMTLNGNPYTSGTQIATSGYYTLVISGTGGYTKTLYFTVSPNISGVIDGTEYVSAVTPVVANAQSLTLNGNSHTSGTAISKAGNYTLQINGVGGYSKIISFSIKLAFSGVSDNGMYLYSVIPVISNAVSLTLNGNSYTSGTPVEKFGYHTLVITGVGGFTQTLHFTVLPNIGGVTDGEERASAITPVVANAQSLTLNSNPYESGTQVEKFGYHTLVITGVGGFTQTLHFTVLPNIGGVTDGEERASAITPVVANAQSLTLNGNPYVGTKISEVGNYTLVIKGVGGYTRTLHFTVLPNISDVTDGKEYDPAVIIPIIDNAQSLKLNGKSYTSGMPIFYVGTYTLQINGVGGYSKTISFSIKLAIDNVVDGTEYTSSVTPIIANAQSLTLNGNPYVGTKISDVGNYTLVITGEGGYSKTVSFSIKLVINNVADNGTYTAAVTPIIHNAQSLTLNGSTYTSGTQIVNFGYHTLVITGAGGYTRTLHFTVLPNISGVADNGMYTAAVTPIIYNAASLALNGSTYTSGTQIVNFGYHTLVITGAGGYTQTLYFTVLPNISGVTDDTEYIAAVTPVVANANANTQSLTLNGKGYESGTAISGAGNYTLVITGMGGYTRSLYFTVLPIIVGVTDGGEYPAAVTPIIDNAQSLALNGKEYKSGTAIPNVGNYTLRINGAGGYSKTVSFSITKFIIDGIENNKIYAA